MPNNPFFGEDALGQLRSGLERTSENSRSLRESYASMSFTSVRAREFAHHGFARRVQTLARCIENVFEILPPDTVEIPSRNNSLDATINIQAAIFNVFATSTLAEVNEIKSVEASTGFVVLSILND